MDNYQFQADVEHKTLDGGTPAWAVKPGPGDIAPIPAVPGSTTVEETFDGTLWTQITFVSGDWTVDTINFHSAPNSFRSKVIGNSQTTSFFIQNDVFEPQLSFWARTLTETNFDFLRIFVDNVQVYQESGNLPLHRVSIPIGFGFDIEFRYTKDFSSAPAGDGIWVDDIVLGGLDTPEVPGSPAHPLVYTPLYLDDDDNLKVTLLDQVVAVTGIPNLDCETDSVTTCQGTDPWTVDGTVAVSNFPDVYPTGALTNGAQTAVAAASVSILSSNINRKACLIQNVGLANVRVGVTGVSNTTGFRLVPGQIVILEMPFVPTQAIFAIREGLISSTVLVMEIT